MHELAGNSFQMANKARGEPCDSDMAILVFYRRMVVFTRIFGGSGGSMCPKQTLSSNIRSVHYDLTTQELTIQYYYSGSYRYRNVPPEVYTELQHSPVPDKVIERIVKPRFPAVKLLTV